MIAQRRADDGADVQAMRRMARAGFRRHYGEAARARLAAAVATQTPFPARLVHFWANHFAISADKQSVVGFAGNYENEAIRPHVMGKFSDLLTAAVHHPAILLFLDQARSEEHTSELQSLMRISYAVFCLKKKTKHTTYKQHKIVKKHHN